MRLALKFAIVLFLTLAILLPLAMIRGTISERQQFRRQAVEEVTRSYAGAQRLAGPVLVVPYREQVEEQERDASGVPHTRVRVVERQWTFFPKTLRLQGRVLPSIRRRGLHEVRVYELQAMLDAAFDVRLPAADPARPRTLGTPWIDLGIGDVRGLVGAPRLRLAGNPVAVLQGQRGHGGGGLHAMLAAGAGADGRIALPLRLEFALRGTESLAVVPLADDNRIVLDSPWPHPQFNGDFLPRAHRIDARGFHAEWDVSSLASTAQAQYRTGEDKPVDAIGLSLVEPVNLYSKVDRATKYGLLFVLLTFTGFFMLETIKQLPIHPVQYALVGLALAIFFLLLLSLSEHLDFGWAYLVAAVACVGLIGHYLGHVLRSRLRGLGFAATLGLLYAALYGLLVSEDNALVLGSGLLFAILAAIMVATRKVDWYQLSARMPARSP
jgi:inner membrane protein